ncbi:MAG: NfeD family protein [Ignavibacteriae bacterium]|nr:NfeD family protein [Ignavibacteriota bacterium]
MLYYWWFAAAVLFFILEIVTPGFVLLWFGVGALLAGLLDLAGVHNPLIQTLVFVVVSIVLVFLSRTVFKNVFMRASPGADLKTNADAMLGRAGIVTETIDNEHSLGRVLVDGQDWAARSADGSVIEVSARVTVQSLDGAKFIVART